MGLALQTLKQQIKPEMTWRGAAEAQIDAFERLALQVGSAYEISGTHRSKSIDLPIMRFERPTFRITVLDNFHECNVHFDGEPVAGLTYEDCGYKPIDYLAEIRRAEGYSWRGWTEEEINDPRITRVPLPDGRGGAYWSEKEPAEKERWLRRFTDASWWSHEWSSGVLLGDVAAVLDGREPCLWCARAPYADDRGPYRPDATQFSLVFPRVDDERVVNLIKRLI